VSGLGHLEAVDQTPEVGGSLFVAHPLIISHLVFGGATMSAGGADMSLVRAIVVLSLVSAPVLAQPPAAPPAGAQRDRGAPTPRDHPLGAKADFHVHLKSDLTLDAALLKSHDTGICYGVAINGGLSFPINSDAGLEPFLQEMRGKPAYVAFQAEGREWVRLFTRPALERFDYVFTDAMTWTDDNGRRMRLWIKEDVGDIADPQRFMDMLVSRATGIFDNEPIDLYVNPTFLPAELQADYEKLWTPERMKAIVDGLARNGIGMEINNRYHIPSAAFITLAKRAGVKFACGTNNTSAADLGANEYCIQMIRACDLGPRDFWAPPAEGRKAVQRRPLTR
jgi:hypothetical protein